MRRDMALDSSRGPFSSDTDEYGNPVVERWKLIILEDSGELLASDAKQRTGQALSRLLNIADGLIGQGLKVLILITTNEEMDSLHEAISRPGRCASKIVFPRLSKDEALEWAAHNGISMDIENDMSLAELYGVMEDFSKAPEKKRRSMGFAHKEEVAEDKPKAKKSLGFDVGSRPVPEPLVGSEQTAYTEEVEGQDGGMEEYINHD
jgi:hypothetical protein